MLLHLGRLVLQLGQLLVEGRQALLETRIGLLGQRHPLDLELEDAALHDVDLGRERVDLDAQLRRRLVHEVDRLVGQEAVGEVAVGQHGCVTSAESWMRTPMHLVALLQAPQDGDGVLDRRLADVHLLEAALECRSFSTCLRYSSRVVAPIMRSSPPPASA